MAKIPKTAGNSSAPVEAKEVHLKGGKKPGEAVEATTFDDEAALKIVTQNARAWAAWIEEKQWGLRWNEADILYQSPRIIKAWEGSDQPEPSISSYKLLDHVNSIHPQVMEALFYDDPPFRLVPVGPVDADILRARTAFLAHVLKKIGFETECGRCMFSILLLGTGIMKRGASCTNKIVKKRVRKGAELKVDMPVGGSKKVSTKGSEEFEVIKEPVLEWWPFVENCNIRFLLVDPDTRVPDARKANIIDERFVTFRDLDNMRNEVREDGEPLYKIPDRDTLLSFFIAPEETPDAPSTGSTAEEDSVAIHHAKPRWMKTNEDPTLCKLKLWEMVDVDKNVMVVLQEDLVIRNDSKVEIGYYSSNWFDIMNAFWGIGLGRVIGQRQRVEQGLTSAGLKVVNLELDAPWVVAEGAGIHTQNVRARLGGFIKASVADPSKAMAKVPMPQIPPEVWAMLQANAASAEASSGADASLTQGQSSQRGRGGVFRSPVSARAAVSANAARIKGPVGRFVETVFIPVIADIDEMCLDHMPAKQIKKIIGSMLGEDFANKLNMDKFLNTEFTYDVLAGAHLAAQIAMALSIPLVIQLLQNGVFLKQLQDMGWTVDVLSLAKLIADSTGSKNFKELFRQMTPQELQQKKEAALQAAQAQNAGKMQLESLKGQNKSQQIQEEHQAQLAQDLLENSLPRATADDLRQAERPQVSEGGE